MSQATDFEFAPLGAEEAYAAMEQQQAIEQLLDDAMRIVEKPVKQFNIPSMYDDKLIRLIDSVPVE